MKIESSKKVMEFKILMALILGRGDVCDGIAEMADCFESSVHAVFHGFVVNLLTWRHQISLFICYFECFLLL